MIIDSGTRREFETGAVRDMQEGKGRCDIMPLEIIADYIEDSVISHIHDFQTTGDTGHLYSALDTFSLNHAWIKETMILEVAKHFEEGCKKYGENNWRKGIPVSCYIDSAIRHYLKWRRGDMDERHDRAFAWNILCCCWEVAREAKCESEEKSDDKN